MATDEITDNPARSRFECGSGDATAELVYRIDGNRLDLLHTGVPDSMSGRGIGGRLVSAAVERARREGLDLVPSCSYARKWLGDHPDRVEGVRIDWDG